MLLSSTVHKESQKIRVEKKNERRKGYYKAIKHFTADTFLPTYQNQNPSLAAIFHVTATRQFQDCSNFLRAF